MDTLTRSLAHHSLTVNIATSIFLAVLCVASCATLMTLFLTQGLHTRSLTHVEGGIIPPTAVISVLGIILISATSALVTRAVEHGLWAKILYKNPYLDDATPSVREELHRHAQWSVSPLARLTYAFQGQSWLMRMSGILLLSTAVLNPVLLYGVSPKDVFTPTVVEINPNQNAFSGFITTPGSLYGFDGTCISLTVIPVTLTV
jgi:hypothetical protein